MEAPKIAFVDDFWATAGFGLLGPNPAGFQNTA